MITFKIANQWARALFNLTVSEEQMISRKEILSQITFMLLKTPKFGQFIFNPQVSMREKKEVFQKGISDIQLANYLSLLSEKGKFKYLPEIAKKYQSMVMEYKGIIEAKLMIAAAIDSDLKAELQMRLEKNYGKTFIIHEKINPEIIGGAVLIFDNRMIDFSIAGRLEKMKKNLL
jgi:F-type H+-transporting ATPase subunit delta